MASAMELHRLHQCERLAGAGNDAIELLAWSIYVRSAGEHHREAIGLIEAVKMKIACCPADGIRSTWCEVIVLLDPSPIGAAVNLWSGHVHIFGEMFLPKGIV